MALSVDQRGHELYLIVGVQDDGVGLHNVPNIERIMISIRDRALALNGCLHLRSRFGLRVHVLLRQQIAPYMKSVGSTSTDQRALRADFS